MSDWLAKAKKEYMRGGVSYRQLAEKYGVSRSAIEKPAKRENWVDLRRQAEEKATAKTIEIIAKQKADRATRVQELADRLIDKLEQAISELDRQMAKCKKTTKTYEYNNYERPDKPTKEIVDEKEELTEVSSIVDRKGVRDIAAALKDVREVLHIRTEDEKREERARIANLERQSEKDTTENEPIVVTFDADAEAWSQ